jgi:hypothetical protein
LAAGGKKHFVNFLLKIYCRYWDVIEIKHVPEDVASSDILRNQYTICCIIFTIEPMRISVERRPHFEKAGEYIDWLMYC